MKRYGLALLFLAVFCSAAAAEVFHTVDANKDEIMVNTTLELDCSQAGSNCPVNSWRLSWNMPENSQVISVKDSYGNITDYTFSSGELDISTNSGPPRETERVKISTVVPSEAEEIHDGLFKQEISLAGLPGEQTAGVVRNPDIISGWTSGRFNESFSNGEMKFRGTGSTNIRVNFGEGNKTAYYEFFGGNPDNTSLAYQIGVGMTGLSKPFDRFPVALMDSEEYEGSVTSWSSGEYVAGSFRMREGLEDRFLPVLVHETVHGLNERSLEWDRTSSTWFDEGTAKYVESMTSRYVNGEERTRKLFSEDTVYYETRNGTRYRVTLPSSGNPDALWSYYQGNRSFMKNWNPRKYPSQRDFGYAYSELIIRNYVVNQNKSLRNLYNQLNPDKPIETNTEKWSFYSRILELEPCNFESRERFDRCLERINEYDYKVYRVENFSRQDTSMDVQPLEIDQSEPVRFSGVGNVSMDSSEVQSNLFSILGGFEDFLQNIWGRLDRWIR